MTSANCKEKETSLIERDSIGMTYNLLNVDNDKEENKFDADEIAAAKCLLNYNLGPTSIIAFGGSNTEKNSRACMVVSSEKSRQNMALVAAASRRKMGSLLKITVDGYKILKGQDNNKQLRSFSGKMNGRVPKYLCLFDRCAHKHDALSPLQMTDRYNFYHRMNVRELDNSSCINLSEQEFLQYSRSYDFKDIKFWTSRKNREELIDKIAGLCEFYCIEIKEEMMNDIRLVYLSDCESDDCICSQFQFSDVNIAKQRAPIQLPSHLYDESFITKDIENLHVTLETLSFLARHLQRGSVPSRDLLSCLGHERPELTMEQLEVVFPCIICRIYKDNIKWSKNPLYSLLLKEETLNDITNSTQSGDISFQPNTTVTKQDLIPFCNIIAGPLEIYDYGLNMKKLSSIQTSFRPYTINLMTLKTYCTFD